MFYEIVIAMYLISVRSEIDFREYFPFFIILICYIKIFSDKSII